VETRLKGYKYFEIERYFFNKFRMKRPPNNFLPNQKIGELMANISFDVIHLCQTILQCPKTTQMQCYSKGISIRTPSLLKKSLSISKYLYPLKRVSTPIRRNFFTKDDGNFTADLQNVSFLSLDESKNN
jgi:hypothetical protein